MAASDARTLLLTITGDLDPALYSKGTASRVYTLKKQQDGTWRLAGFGP